MIAKPAPGTYLPRQTIKLAFGMRGGSSHLGMEFADANNGIMDMDAPEWLPAGSTYRKEEKYSDGVTWYSAHETLIERDAYRYGRGRACATARATAMTITSIRTLGGYRAVNIRELRAAYYARLAYIRRHTTEAQP